MASAAFPFNPEIPISGCHQSSKSKLSSSSAKASASGSCSRNSNNASSTRSRASSRSESHHSHRSSSSRSKDKSGKDGHEKKKSEGNSSHRQEGSSSHRTSESGKATTSSQRSRSPHQEPPPIATPPAEGWGCPDCSYLNTEEDEVCNVCHAIKPRQPWICAMCGQRNIEDAKVCCKCQIGFPNAMIPDRNREGENLSPRSNMINMFLTQLAYSQLQTRNAEREGEAEYKAKAPKVPWVDPKKAKPLLVKPFGPYGNITCDVGHYLRHRINPQAQCDSCFKRATMYSCEPCEYHLCLKCVKEEVTGRKTIYSDDSSMSSWASESESVPTSAAWTQHSHLQDETQSTCDETNKQNNGASSSETGAKSKRKSKAEEKAQEKKKRSERKKHRERRRRKHRKDDRLNAAPQSSDAKNINVEYRFLYNTACLAHSRSSGNAYQYSRELPEPKLCVRDLLVTECGDPRANGEYAQYDHIYRNTHNSQVIIYWDAETKTYYHLKCDSNMDSMEDINEVLLDRENKAQTMYKNVTRSVVMPLAIPNDGWETVDEKFGVPGKYVVTSLRLKKIMKNLHWMEMKDLYNTVSQSLELTPKEVISKILVYAGINSVWSWATTCKVLASDLSDPHDNIWNELSHYQRYKDTPGRSVVKRRRFSFCGRQPAEEGMDHVYDSPKEMCRDENRMNTWISLINWHRPAFTFRHNGARCGIIANMSLDMKRNYLVLHVIHNLQTESSKYRISPFGATIAKYRENPSSKRSGPVFTGEVAFPVRQEIVYERLRERHVLVYFTLNDEEKKKRPSSISNLLRPFKPKPFSWERKTTYFYIHRQDALGYVYDMKNINIANRLMRTPYVPMALFSILDYPNPTLRRTTGPVEEYFNTHTIYRSKIDTFALLPETAS